MAHAPTESPLLGDVPLRRTEFAGLERMFEDFSHERFSQLNARQRYERICRSLLSLVETSPEEAFLLPAFADFLDRVTEENLLASSLNQTGFEMWLNLISGVDEETNYKARAKIAGKYLPRTAYQNLFPIGMGNFYPGSHFVTAHNPPDLDTTTASFWGWLDAFAARVGENVHIWNVPGPVPSLPVTQLFDELLGPAIFRRISKHQQRLTMCGRDLVTRKNLIRKKGHESMDDVDHDRYENAVIVVDDQGFYMGDWRSSDVEGVRQILRLMNDVLQAFENHVMLELIGLFSHEELTRDQLKNFVNDAFMVPFDTFIRNLNFNDEQRRELDQFMDVVLGVPGGSGCCVAEFGAQMDKLTSSSFAHLRASMQRLLDPEMYEGSGYLREDRTRIFNLLQMIYVDLDRAIQTAMEHTERLDVALATKRHILGFPPNYVTTRTDVDEIRAKIGSYTHFTVAYEDTRRNLIPVGIIRSVDLRKGTLGTASLRDFGNFEEIQVAPYLQVISVIDHHKTSIQTASPPLAIIGDAQSTCVLLAEQAFLMNDAYSQGGMTVEQIDAQIAEITTGVDITQADMRILQRLYTRKMAARTRGPYYIHPEREFAEYLSFLNAILDDTDLLTKVTRRDVEVTAELLNRLKSLLLQREVEIVSFDGIPIGPDSAKEAAKILLRDEDLHSFYRKIFHYRQQEVESRLANAVGDSRTNLFEDTKRQNGCCMVGQVKIFKTNYETFAKNADGLRRTWLTQAKRTNSRAQKIDLHLQMISTIAGAEEAYAGRIDGYDHLDEIWIWWTDTQRGALHMQSFLMGFSTAKATTGVMREIEIIGPAEGDHVADLRQIFPDVTIIETPSDDGESMAVLRFTAGRLNSRKAFISPYLPKLVD